MKAQTVRFMLGAGGLAPNLEDGLEITERQHSVRLYLGGWGEGGKEGIVSFHKRFPAEVIKGRVHRAFLFRVQHDIPFLVLTNPTKEDDKLLIRFVTRGDAQGSVFGEVSRVEGLAQQQVFGLGPNKAWLDELWMMGPGSQVLITTSGSGKQFNFRYSEILSSELTPFVRKVLPKPERLTLIPDTPNLSKYARKQWLKRQEGIRA